MKPPFVLHTSRDPDGSGATPSLCGQLRAPYHWSRRHGPGHYNYLLPFAALELVLNHLPYALDLIPCEKCETKYAKECGTIRPRTKDAK